MSQPPSSSTIQMVIRIKSNPGQIELPVGLNDKMISGLELVNWNLEIPGSNQVQPPFIQVSFSQGFMIENLNSGPGLRNDSITIPITGFQHPRPIVIKPKRLIPRVFSCSVYDDNGSPLEFEDLTMWFDVKITNWW